MILLMLCCLCDVPSLITCADRVLSQQLFVVLVVYQRFPWISCHFSSTLWFKQQTLNWPPSLRKLIWNDCWFCKCLVELVWSSCVFCRNTWVTSTFGRLCPVYLDVNCGLTWDDKMCSGKLRITCPPSSSSFPPDRKRCCVGFSQELSTAVMLPPCCCSKELRRKRQENVWLLLLFGDVFPGVWRKLEVGQTLLC